MNYRFAKTVTATVAAGALLVLSAAASATTIDTHNGTKDSFPAGSGNVDVLVDDAGGACQFTADFCLDKFWFPESLGDVHEMDLTDLSARNPLAELIFNVTDTPWTDYHIEIDGGAFTTITALFSEFINGESVTDIFSVTWDFSADAIWLFFDEPLLPSDPATFDPETFTGKALLFFTNFTPDTDIKTVTLTQHPSFDVPEPASLALFGFGLLGLGAMRRRRRTG